MSDDIRAEDTRNPALAGARADARPVPVPTPTTHSNNIITREQVASELSKRGINGVMMVMEGLPDLDCDRAMKVMAYFDEQEHVRTGLLLKWLREDFDPPAPSKPAARSTPESRSRKQYDRYCDWARRERFSERMGPFAASAYATLKFMRMTEPTRAEVKARVLKQYPWLEHPPPRDAWRERWTA